MRTIHLVLERGFGGEEATVLLDGEERERTGPLHTDLMMGFAAQLALSLPEGEGEVLELHISSSPPVSIPLPAGPEDLWIRAWLLPEGTIAWELGREPLAFL